MYDLTNKSFFVNKDTLFREFGFPCKEISIESPVFADNLKSYSEEGMKNITSQHNDTIFDSSFKQISSEVETQQPITIKSISTAKG